MKEECVSEMLAVLSFMIRSRLFTGPNEEPRKAITGDALVLSNTAVD